MKHVNLTGSGRVYLLTNLLKIQDNKDKFPEAAQVDFGKYLPDIITKLEGLNVETGGNLEVSKKGARLLQVFLEMATNVLEKSIIPGYTQRMITPASKKKYKPYLEGAKVKNKMLKEILEQLV